MPSSTSDSRQFGADKALGMLLVVLLLYCGTLEVTARYGFSRSSRIQKRIAEARREAIRLPCKTSGGSPTVLIVGNSLLLRGVNPDELQKEAAPRYHVAVLAIENTQYIDWYFGIRRLFTEGSRPSMLILCLSMRQLISQGTDGEYFAHYMMQGSDLFAVKETARLNLTTTSNFLFANLSAWLGSRSSVRNWLLSELMPNVEQLTSYLPPAVTDLPATQVEDGLKRLRALQELCLTSGSRFVLLIPPSLRPDSKIEQLRLEAARSGIPVLIPYRAGEMPAGDFEDGFHLNSSGAEAFTGKLAEELLGFDRAD